MASSLTIYRHPFSEQYWKNIDRLNTADHVRAIEIQECGIKDETLPVAKVSLTNIPPRIYTARIKFILKNAKCVIRVKLK